jgi:hypothetical protein
MIDDPHATEDQRRQALTELGLLARSLVLRVAELEQVAHVEGR